MEAGKDHLAVREVDVRELVDETVVIAEPLFLNSPLNLVVGEVPALTLNTDPDRVRRRPAEPPEAARRVGQDERVRTWQKLPREPAGRPAELGNALEDLVEALADSHHETTLRQA